MYLMCSISFNWSYTGFFIGLNKLSRLRLRRNWFTFDGMEDIVTIFLLQCMRSKDELLFIKTTVRFPFMQAAHSATTHTNGLKMVALVSTINGDSTFTPTGSGAYNVEVTNSIATALTLYSDTVSFTALKAVEQNNIAAQTLSENRFSVYPSPARTMATVSFKTTGNYTLLVTDISGRVLKTKAGIAVKGVNSIQLNVSGYAAGMYFDNA